MTSLSYPLVTTPAFQRQKKIILFGCQCHPLYRVTWGGVPPNDATVIHVHYRLCFCK